MTIDRGLFVADIDLIDQLAAAPNVAAVNDRGLLFALTRKRRYTLRGRSFI
jgi:hypothetical protein